MIFRAHVELLSRTRAGETTQASLIDEFDNTLRQHELSIGDLGVRFSLLVTV
jgi:hypothetical protein